MKKESRVIVSMSICLSIVFSAFFTASARAASNSNALSLPTLKTMAANIAKTTMKWPDTSLSNIHTLYNFNGKIIAYSVDVTNNATKQQGYELISSSPNDEPVMEFSKEMTSPYDKVASKNDTCIFSGFGGYYAKSSSASHYYDLHSGQKLPDSEVSQFSKSDAKKSYVSKRSSNARSVRNKLMEANLSSVRLMDDAPAVTLDVPFYVQTTLACAPTSAAMALKYDWPDEVPDKDSMIAELESKMNWDPLYKGVPFNNIPSGITGALNDWGISQDSSQCFNMTSETSTFTLAQSEIDSNRPLLITAPHYTQPGSSPSGHCMCIVGYCVDSDGYNQYFICHDTWNTYNVDYNYNNDAELGDDFAFTLINYQ